MVRGRPEQSARDRTGCSMDMDARERWRIGTGPSALLFWDRGNRERSPPSFGVTHRTSGRPRNPGRRGGLLLSAGLPQQLEQRPFNDGQSRGWPGGWLPHDLIQGTFDPLARGGHRARSTEWNPSVRLAQLRWAL